MNLRFEIVCIQLFKCAYNICTLKQLNAYNIMYVLIIFYS